MSDQKTVALIREFEHVFFDCVGGCSRYPGCAYTHERANLKNRVLIAVLRRLTIEADTRPPQEAE